MISVKLTREMYYYIYEIKIKQKKMYKLKYVNNVWWTHKADVSCLTKSSIIMFN